MVETSPKHILIGAMVAALVLVGGIYMISNDNQTGFKDRYGQTLSTGNNYDEFANKTITYYQGLQSSTETIEGNIKNAETQQGLLGALNGLIQTAWGSLKNLFSTLGFINDYMSYTSTKVLGIPSFVAVLLWSIIIIIIAFSIWSAIFQKEF